MNQLISQGSTPWTYDANGNVLDDGRNTYTWDAENRLTQISNKTTGQVSEFRYDGLSRRVAILERASAGAPATETRYLWCGDRICQARDASGNVTARFFPQGEANMVAGSPVLSYYAKDNLGSVVQMVDTTGAAVGEQRYTDYGGLELSTGKKPTFGYAGMFQHNPSALSLTQYRAYDPSTGRWLSRDPIEEAGGLNLYGYVGGNPISYVDPNGHELVGAAAGAVIGGVIGAGTAALDPNNSALAIATSGVAGAATGAITGLIDPAAVGGALVGGLGDLAGQIATNLGNGNRPLCNLNPGEAIGAALAGGTGGWALRGSSEIVGNSLANVFNTVLGLSGVVTGALGGGIYHSVTGQGSTLPGF